MKKIIFFCAFVIPVFAFAQRPTDKGWRSVGGTGNLRFDLDASDGTVHQFTLGPEVYWFVANSFALGTDFGFGMYASKTNQGDTVTFRSQSISLWVTPGFRFYFREPEKAWRPYVFANAGLGYTGNHVSVKHDNNSANDTDGRSSNSGFRGYTGAGMAWFFSDHAAFDIRLRVLDYNIDALQYDPVFSIGVQAFFD